MCSNIMLLRFEEYNPQKPHGVNMANSICVDYYADYQLTLAASKHPFEFYCDDFRHLENGVNFHFPSALSPNFFPLISVQQPASSPFLKAPLSSQCSVISFSKQEFDIFSFSSSGPRLEEIISSSECIGRMQCGSNNLY